MAGDGCIVSTPTGSSAYALAAGGPLIEPDLEALLITPLTAHGGSCPPLVVRATSVIRLDATTGFGGARLELDGQVADAVRGPVTISLRRGVATLVGFPDQEPFLTVLRQRQIIADSPRIVAEEAER
jgi:NAD+ kinase